jgi:hypothetical protein
MVLAVGVLDQLAILHRGELLDAMARPRRQMLPDAAVDLLAV